ncbi:cytochrome P450 9e2-like [Leptopilina heterotoma]|uniref:cytochrome P450 9e2-like n=1 Tax=Leptopilina heterotoma TaxID=63436 RepID=UPI001CAA0CD0|nr:cytochrome P450 9e2-like [Leptopilina heterotoma]
MESLNLALWTLIVGALCLLFFFLHYKAHFWERKNTPHLRPILIFGNTVSFFFQTVPITKFVNDIYNSFPNAKYFGMMDIHTPIAVLRDPDLIKEICVKNFDNFLDHQAFIDETMDPIFGKNVFSLKGERWREVRNTLSPSFTATKMKFMFELIEKCAKNFVQYYMEHPEMTESIESKDAFTRYTNDVIATAAFGISVDSLKDRENEFYLMGKDATAFGKGLRALKFLIFRTCPQIMKLIGEPFLARSTDRFFKNLVSETVKVRKEKNIIRPDMIHLMMEASNKENGVKLTIDDIIAQSFIFFLAGFDTTATAMCFVAHELAMNPEIQDKLRNEIDTFTENREEKITYETISKMKYLDMVISEALRKYPPAPSTDRLCIKKYTLPKATPDSEEYTALPKSVVWIPIQGLHHDPKYYPDPEKFDPERFNDENKDKIHPYAYLPFGIGPRKCIANRFALMETKILIVYILQKFILEKSVKTKHPIEFQKGFAIVAKGGLWVKFTKRDN